MYWQTATAETLRTLVRQPRLGLVTDVDGTISPIVDQPDAAQVTPRARELLAALRPHLALLAVITGRAVTDVRERVGVPGLVYVGNHGLETWADGAVQLAPEVAVYRPAVEAARDELLAVQRPRMLVEDKGATLSVHYRQTADPAAIQAEFTPIAAQIAERHGLRLFEGRMIYELRPPLDMNKGTAFRALVQRYDLSGAIYLGDDTTDADAMQVARALREAGACYALALGVGDESMPAVVRESADLTATSVQDVEAFLGWLLSALSASSTC